MFVRPITYFEEKKDEFLLSYNGSALTVTNLNPDLTRHFVYDFRRDGESILTMNIPLKDNNYPPLDYTTHGYSFYADTKVTSPFSPTGGPDGKGSYNMLDDDTYDIKSNEPVLYPTSDFSEQGFACLLKKTSGFASLGSRMLVLGSLTNWAVLSTLDISFDSNGQVTSGPQYLRFGSGPNTTTPSDFFSVTYNYDGNQSTPGHRLKVRTNGVDTSPGENKDNYNSDFPGSTSPATSADPNYARIGAKIDSATTWKMNGEICNIMYLKNQQFTANQLADIEAFNFNKWSDPIGGTWTCMVTEIDNATGNVISSSLTNAVTVSGRPPVRADLQLLSGEYFTDGNSKLNWIDSSGNEKNLISHSSSNNPTIVSADADFNSQDSLSFPTAGIAMSNSTFSSFTPRESFLVVYQYPFSDPPARSQYFVAAVPGFTTALTHLGGIAAEAPHIYWLYGNGNALGNSNIPGVTYNEPIIMHGVITTGENSPLGINALRSVGTETSAVEWTVSGVPFGPNAHTGWPCLECKFAEVLVYTRVLTNSERGNVLSYLNAKFYNSSLSTLLTSFNISTKTTITTAIDPNQRYIAVGLSDYSSVRIFSLDSNYNTTEVASITAPQTGFGCALAFDYEDSNRLAIAAVNGASSAVYIYATADVKSPWSDVAAEANANPISASFPSAADGPPKIVLESDVVFIQWRAERFHILDKAGNGTTYVQTTVDPSDVKINASFQRYGSYRDLEALITWQDGTAGNVRTLYSVTPNAIRSNPWDVTKSITTTNNTSCAMMDLTGGGANRWAAGNVFQTDGTVGVYVFEKVAGTWTNKTVLTSSPTCYSSSTSPRKNIKISPDGNTIVTAGAGNNQILVFKTSDNWTTHTSTLLSEAEIDCEPRYADLTFLTNSLAIMPVASQTASNLPDTAGRVYIYKLPL